MKKIIFPLLFSTLFFATQTQAQAQTKASKESIIGKWKMAAIGIEEIMYYDFVKDSSSAGLSDMIKSGLLESIKGGWFEFNADSSFSTSGNPAEDSIETGNYEFDEAKQTINLKSSKQNEKNKESDKFKIYFKNDRLVLEIFMNEKKHIVELVRSK